MATVASGQQSAVRPGVAPALVAMRSRLGLVIVLFALAGARWWWTAHQMRGMDAGPWSALGGLGGFLGVWVVMMAAMMLPSVAPTVALYSRMTRRRSPVLSLIFVAGYLVTWAAAGLAAVAVGAGGSAVAGTGLEWNHAGRVLAGVTLLGAAGYQQRRNVANAEDGLLVRIPPRNGRTPATEPAASGHRAITALAPTPLVLNGMVATVIEAWEVTGSYFEACNCDAVCPCRRVDGRAGGRSTHGVCQFALSWQISRGVAGALPLDGLAVVMAGWYDDDEHDSPWRVILYVDESANPEQRDALVAIFLGRAGGSTLSNFAAAIGTVHAVRSAHIELSHVPRRWHMRADTYLEVSATTPAFESGTVSCGIPGHDRPGQEVITDTLAVHDAPLSWELHERCGFATDFRYFYQGEASPG